MKKINKLNKSNKNKDNEIMIAEDNFELTEEEIKKMERKLEEEFGHEKLTLAECYFESNYHSLLLPRCQNLLKKQLNDLSRIMIYNNVINTFELADKIQYYIECIKASITSHHDANNYWFEQGIEFCDDLIRHCPDFKIGEDTHD